MRLNGLSSTFRRRDLWRASGRMLRVGSSNVQGTNNVYYLLLPGPGVHMMPSLILYCLRKQFIYGGMKSS